MDKQPVVLFNGPIITANGTFRMTDLGVEKARRLVQRHGFVSAIGHDASARVLSDILQVSVPKKRIEYKQAVGQKAIALKLNVRPPEGEVLNRVEMHEVGFSLKLIERIS